MPNVYLQSPSGEVFTTSNPEYHKDCARLTQKAGKEARKEYARKVLREMIIPGQKVYCTLRHVSSSGMQRAIRLHILKKPLLGAPEIQTIDSLVSDAIDCKLHDKGGLKIDGCGMDMGFQLVYLLGMALWPNGTPTPHGTRNGAPDSNGGYALKHEWL